jgi:cytochrome bd-type quinol oxidase subunit 2
VVAVGRWGWAHRPVGPGRYPRDQALHSVIGMEITTHTGTSSTDQRTRAAFAAAQRCTWVYGAFGAAALVAVVAVAGSDQPVNTFMWVRAVLLPVVAVLLHRLAAAGSRGSRRAFERLSALALVMPVAIIGVDLVPGVCPPWYTAVQAACMLPVIRLALLTRFSALRSAFPKTG